MVSCQPVTVMQIADLNTTYPDIDMGVGIGYNWLVFENSGHARLGNFVAADLNPDLSMPNWTSYGIFLSREIQRNVTIGGTTGYRCGDIDGWQWGLFAGIDVYPWLRNLK